METGETAKLLGKQGSFEQRAKGPKGQRAKKPKGPRAHHAATQTTHHVASQPRARHCREVRRPRVVGAAADDADTPELALVEVAEHRRHYAAHAREQLLGGGGHGGGAAGGGDCSRGRGRGCGGTWSQRSRRSRRRGDGRGRQRGGGGGGGGGGQGFEGRRRDGSGHEAVGRGHVELGRGGCSFAGFRVSIVFGVADWSSEEQLDVAFLSRLSSVVDRPALSLPFRSPDRKASRHDVGEPVYRCAIFGGE